MARRLGGRMPLTKRFDKEMAKYLPIFGVWLIDIALSFGWYRPVAAKRWPEIFEDTDFCAMIGIAPVEGKRRPFKDDEGTELEVTTGSCRRILQEQRAMLGRQNVSPKLPLLKNISFMAELLDLNGADRAILLFAAGLKLFPQFEGAICPHNERVATSSFCKLLAQITGESERDLMTALSPDGPLVTTGLVKVVRHVCELESKVSCIDGLDDVLLLQHSHPGELMERFMRRVEAASSLALDDFRIFAGTAIFSQAIFRARSRGGSPVSTSSFTASRGPGKASMCRRLPRRWR